MLSVSQSRDSSRKATIEAFSYFTGNAMFVKLVLGTVVHSLPAQFQSLSRMENSSDSGFCDMNICL